MGVDVSVAIAIDRPPATVMAFASDPMNDPAWIGGIRSVEILSPGPVGAGTIVKRVASFLGRKIDYTTEITDLEPGVRLTMTSLAGPFPLAVTYGFEPATAGTRMTIRNTGDPKGLFRLTEPLLKAAIRRNVRRDLAALKSLLETADPPAPLRHAS